MIIIDAETNNYLANISHYPLGGFISGPQRLISAIAQIAFNIFLFFPAAILTSFKIHEITGSKSPLDHILDGFSNGLEHMNRSFVEIFMPLSFLYLTSNDCGLISNDRVNYIKTDRPWEPVEKQAD